MSALPGRSRPPKIAAAKPLMAMPTSELKDTGCSGVSSTPARPPRPPPSPKATRPMRLTSMPTSRAARGLLEQAVKPAAQIGVVEEQPQRDERRGR